MAVADREDVNGHALARGDCVVYAVTKYQTAVMRFGIIEGITDKDKVQIHAAALEYDGYDQTTKENRYAWKLHDRVSTLDVRGRMMKIEPTQMPPPVQKLLGEVKARMDREDAR